MAFALGCEGLCLEYSSRVLFDHVTLGIDEGDRIGIVGRNGDGKSSLLGVLSETLEPDEGRVFKRNDLTVGLLRQTDSLDDEDTVVTGIFGDMPEYSWASDPQTRSILDRLVGPIGPEKRIGTLSGGERRRVDLARVLLSPGDILMLDEPTNHLDAETIAWLAAYLGRRYRQGAGALLVVTHDRWFLDEVCTSMWELHDGRVEPFTGGYSAYVLQRVEREEAQAKAEEKRRNLLRRELAWLSRGARARSSKPKFHVEAANALIAAEPPLRDEVELKRAAVARLGKQAVELVGVSKSYGGKTLLRDVSWTIAPGDRVGLIGPNGAGKTTLLKLIEGAIAPDAGRVKIGKTVKMAVLSQRLEELDGLGDYRVEEVLSRYPRHYEIDGKEVSSAQLLERLGFSHAHFKLPVSHLSGGQKRRLQLMLTLLAGCNVLLLDEPGNDMDIDMLNQIENVLDSWPGTLVLVTHDRYLMEHVTNDQYALIEGSVRHLPGGFDEYVRLMSARSGSQSAFARGTFMRSAPTGEKTTREGEGGQGADDAGSSGSSGSLEAADPSASPEPSDDGVTAPSGEAMARPSSRASNVERRAARKKLASAERRMETLRGKVAAAKLALDEADPSDYESLLACEGELEGLRAQLASVEDEWLEASETLEAFEG